MLCWPFRLPFSTLSRFPGGTLRSEILSAICSCLSLRRATLSIFTNRLTLYPFDRASVSTHLKDTIIVRIIMYRVINAKRYYLPYSIGDSFYCQQHSATTLCNFPLENCDSPRGRNPRRPTHPPPSSSATILATLVITDIGHPVILVTPVCHSHRLCDWGDGNPEERSQPPWGIKHINEGWREHIGEGACSDKNDGAGRRRFSTRECGVKGARFQNVRQDSRSSLYLPVAARNKARRP